MIKSTEFKIRVIKEIVFRRNGTIDRVYPVGAILTATADAGHYWVHSYGGIFKDEAVRI